MGILLGANNAPERHIFKLILSDIKVVLVAVGTDKKHLVYRALYDDEKSCKWS